MAATLAMPRLPTPIAMRAPGLRFSPKRADGEFLLHGGGNIGDAAIGEFLVDVEEARKTHKPRIRRSARYLGKTRD